MNNDAGGVSAHERPVGRPVPEREKDHTLHLGITRIACMLLL